MYSCDIWELFSYTIWISSQLGSLHLFALSQACFENRFGLLYVIQLFIKNKTYTLWNNLICIWKNELSLHYLLGLGGKKHSIMCRMDDNVMHDHELKGGDWMSNQWLN